MPTTASIVAVLVAAVSSVGLTGVTVPGGEAAGSAELVSAPVRERALVDFNGDSFGDLVVSASNEDTNEPDAGAVNVVYGQSGGLGSLGNQFFTQASCPQIRDGLYDFDFFGRATVTGDFNGDRFHDLAVGVPGEFNRGVRFAGDVNVLYGTASGLSCAGAQAWSPSSPDEGDATLANFGSVLATADFDLDGFEDLAIGNPNDDIGNVDRAGAVYVLYGSSGGIGGRVGFWHQERSGVREIAEPRDGFGSALVAGEFGHSPHPDLAIGVPGEDLAVADAGVVHVLYGSASGIDAIQENLWHQDSTAVEGQVEQGDQFGATLTAGNFGRTLHDDLAVGVPYEDTTVENAGAVNVFYGGSTGLMSAANRILFQGDRGVAGVSEPGEFFGNSLAAADFGYTPFDDLAVKVTEDYTPQGPSGAVHIVHGSAAGLVPSSLDQFWIPSDLGDTNGHFGRLAAANLGRGNQADLAIGMPFETISGAPLAGSVAVMYGTVAGLSPTGGQSWDQGPLADTPEPDDYFGTVVTAH